MSDTTTTTLNLYNVVPCDGCNILSIDLTGAEVYSDGDLIGTECLCGYWVSAYCDEEGNVIDGWEM